MEPNPYYEENIPWTPHYPYQEQIFEYQEEASEPREPQEKYQKIQTTPRMPKAQTLTLIRNMKQSLLVISVLGFAGVGWLIASQQAIIQQQVFPTQAIPNAPHSDNTGGFFDQRGGTQFGEHHHHRDFDEGAPPQDQSVPPQDQNSGPISGTHVS